LIISVFSIIKQQMKMEIALIFHIRMVHLGIAVGYFFEVFIGERIFL
jgi:hypothetical protein